MMLIYCLVGFFVLVIVLLPGGSKCDKELDDIQQEKFLKEWNQKHGKKKKN
jgi:hypothetical protein